MHLTPTLKSSNKAAMSEFLNLLLPFQFHNIPVRGRLLRLTGMSEHIPSMEAATECTQTLAEMLAAAALLAHDTKHTLAVSLQLQHPTLGALAFANCSATRNATSVLKAYANEVAQSTPFTTIAATAAIAIPDLVPAQFVLANSARVGVSRSWLPTLAVLKGTSKPS